MRGVLRRPAFAADRDSIATMRSVTTFVRGLSVVAALGLLPAVAACTPQEADAEPSAPSSPSALPTPSPTPTPTPGSAPVRAFGGDCANVLTDPGAVAGFDVTLYTVTRPTGIGTLGGLSCSWHSESAEGFTVYALPDDQVPDAVRASYETTACAQSYDWQHCHLGGSAAGTWVLVSMPALDEVGTAPDLAPALAAALAGAAQWPDPRAAVPAADWWAPVDCAQLATTADFAATFAPEAFESGYPVDFGAGPIDDLLAPTDQWCPWFSYDSMEGIWMNLLPGAGSQWEGSSLDGGTPVEVAGAQAAVMMTEFDSEVLYATDGANVVRIQEAPVPLADLAARVFTALN